MCLKLTDAADQQSKYMCGRGLLAAGVTGYAVKKNTLSPRTFWLGELTWGGNTWNRHWEFLHAGLGSIA